MESVRFVGMDVHKDTIDLAVLGGHGGQVDFERRVGGTPEAVKKVIRQLKRNHLVVAGYEAGCMRVAVCWSGTGSRRAEGTRAAHGLLLLCGTRR